jgi:hypothetical protein
MTSDSRLQFTGFGSFFWLLLGRAFLISLLVPLLTFVSAVLLGV